MTYQEYYNKLVERLQKTTQAHLEADKKLVRESNGFIDQKTLFDYQKAKADWQNAANEYHTFLSFFKEIKPNPDDEIPVDGLD